MKNSKQSVFFGIVAIIALVFGIVACDDGNGKDDPKDQSQIITLTFETESPTATVKGHLTDTEWDGVAVKIKNAINGAFNSGTGLEGASLKNKFRSVYGDGVTIIVEKNPVGYTKWKTSADAETMWLAFGKLDDDLQGTVTDAVKQMSILEEGSE
jgi:hypothetical protein